VNWHRGNGLENSALWVSVSVWGEDVLLFVMCVSVRSVLLILKLLKCTIDWSEVLGYHTDTQRMRSLEHKLVALL